jgi:hypothetical protein
MNVKEIEDHKFDDLKLKLEPLDEEKIGGFMAEIKLLESEIKEREAKIDLIDAEVKLRLEVREMIDNALKDLDFEEEEVHKRWDREKEEDVEYKVPLINRFLHEFEFCDHIELKEENEKGIEVVKEVKHIPWDKESVLKELKLKLDLDKANDLVRSVKNYKHNKKKGELEHKLKDLTRNNVYFIEAFGWEREIIGGEKFSISEADRIAKWDKDDLIFFEEKVKALEEAKIKVDEKDKKDKKLFERQSAYRKVDSLLLEALVEKHEEGRPEKMVEYLKLRKEIKDNHPLED